MMARRKKTTTKQKSTEKRPIESCEHRDKQRVNKEKIAVWLLDTDYNGRNL